THPCDACNGEGKIARTPCSECSGRGRVARRVQLGVEVPPGIADEQRIRLTGRGHAGERGGRAGDLYVVVRVAPDERFVRDGNDLVTVIDLAAPDAALGTKITVPTLDGDEEVEIEPGTQPGSVLTLRGKGMPSLRRGRRGGGRGRAGGAARARAQRRRAGGRRGLGGVRALRGARRAAVAATGGGRGGRRAR